jgi:drug/metabolite transporter (DMT)-like permease
MEARALTGNILALTAAVAFALTNASASLAFSGGSNPSTLAAFRFVLPALVLLVWLTARGRPLRLPKRDGWIAVALGALTAAYSWALLSAIGAIPIALAILIFYLFPLVATIILGLFGWESLGWKTIAAIVVAFIGLLLALDPRVGTINIEGVLFGLAAALGLGIVVAVSSRVFGSGDSRPVTLYLSTVAAILLIGDRPRPHVAVVLRGAGRLGRPRRGRARRGADADAGRRNHPDGRRSRGRNHAEAARALALRALPHGAAT